MQNGYFFTAQMENMWYNDYVYALIVFGLL